MRSTATTAKGYLEELSLERKEAVSELRKQVLENLPEGFEEVLNYGMLGYVVPHSIYPQGYHCDPLQALPFMNIASQKNFVAVYHMGLYADEKLLKWFLGEYAKGSNSKSKLDMGKSCLRFKKMDQIPYALIGELASKITPEKWVEMYEKNFRK